MSVIVCSPSLSTTILQKAQDLAKKLDLPFGEAQRSSATYLLQLSDSRLDLRPNPYRPDGHNFSPLFVDFLEGDVAYRHARNCTIKQPLARAVGIKGGFRPTLFDATAGLGKDSFVLACLGCTVSMHERSPIVAALLADGLARALADTRTAAAVGNRLRLIQGDARLHLQLELAPPYTVYLDPMYPHTGKSALNKKEMRMIRDIVGDDTDGADLLTIALRYAGTRVVVKRPKGAQFLGDRAPTHQITMKNSRFDVYLTHHL
ncbi:MAG: class I SAM-dependent methyltransferase [Desulfopila sp.]